VLPGMRCWTRRSLGRRAEAQLRVAGAARSSLQGAKEPDLESWLCLASRRCLLPE